MIFFDLNIAKKPKNKKSLKSLRNYKTRESCQHPALMTVQSKLLKISKVKSDVLSNVKRFLGKNAMHLRS